MDVVGKVKITSIVIHLKFNFMKIFNTYYDPEGIYVICDCIEETDEEKQSNFLHIGNKEYLIFTKLNVEKDRNMVVGRLRQEGNS